MEVQIAARMKNMQALLISAPVLIILMVSRTRAGVVARPQRPAAMCAFVKMASPQQALPAPLMVAIYALHVMAVLQNKEMLAFQTRGWQIQWTAYLFPICNQIADAPEPPGTWITHSAVLVLVVISARTYAT
jgi:hypothetical protein